MQADTPFPADYIPAFTSANGVRFSGIERPAGPAYAVGKATARAAKAAGFDPVWSAGGDVRVLSEIIEKADKTILHISGSRLAGDLVALLAERGIGAQRRVVYETRTVCPDPAIVSSANWIALYSPFAAQTVQRLLPEGWSGCIAALSAAVAEPLGGRRVVVAKRPNEAALIAAARAEIDRGPKRG